jgi:alkanesulfonate monooxygenase SsuD/methylene tetrahydromethanopterin reductase-like flavin-dependent oxidoreductase (luciferase family)
MRGLWRIWPTKRPRWAQIDEPPDPKPVQKPHPPVWFGGNALAGMRRAAHYGNGFMGAGSQTTSRYAEQVAMVKDELAAQNRDPETFRFGKRVNVHVEEDPTIARTLDYALRHHYGGGEWADHMLAGTAKECVAGIRAVADAGRRPDPSQSARASTIPGCRRRSSVEEHRCARVAKHHRRALFPPSIARESRLHGS